MKFRRAKTEIQQVDRSDLKSAIKSETWFVDNMLELAAKAATDHDAKFNLEMAEGHLRKKLELGAILEDANHVEIGERLEHTRGLVGMWNKSVASNLSEENLQLAEELRDARKLMKQVQEDLAALAKKEAEDAKATQKAAEFPSHLPSESPASP